MKLLITGLNGTLAPVLARLATGEGLRVVGWDRTAIPPDDEVLARSWLEREQPDAIAHLAMGSTGWARLLALYAAHRSIPFVFTSTAMVFHHQPAGPHRVGDERTTQDSYGQYKRDCEDAILSVHPRASIARIGWQIDPSQPGNNMLFALDQWQARDGRVSASEAWIPACSFMEDTATALLCLLRNPSPGATHIDSNATEAHNFATIATALKKVFEKELWQIEPNRDYEHDQRLLNAKQLVPPISQRLSPLLHPQSDA